MPLITNAKFVKNKKAKKQPEMIYVPIADRDGFLKDLDNEIDAWQLGVEGKYRANRIMVTLDTIIQQYCQGIQFARVNCENICSYQIVSSRGTPIGSKWRLMDKLLFSDAGMLHNARILDEHTVVFVNMSSPPTMQKINQERAIFARLVDGETIPQLGSNGTFLETDEHSECLQYFRPMPEQFAYRPLNQEDMMSSKAHMAAFTPDQLFQFPIMRPHTPEHCQFRCDKDRNHTGNPPGGSPYYPWGVPQGSYGFTDRFGQQSQRPDIKSAALPMRIIGSKLVIDTDGLSSITDISDMSVIMVEGNVLEIYGNKLKVSIPLKDGHMAHAAFYLLANTMNASAKKPDAAILSKINGTAAVSISKMGNVCARQQGLDVYHRDGELMVAIPMSPQTGLLACKQITAMLALVQ